MIIDYVCPYHCEFQIFHFIGIPLSGPASKGPLLSGTSYEELKERLRARKKILVIPYYLCQSFDDISNLDSVICNISLK